MLTTDKTVSLIYHIEPESSNNKEKETKNKQVRSLFSTKLSDEQEKSTQKKLFYAYCFLNIILINILSSIVTTMRCYCLHNRE